MNQPIHAMFIGTCRVHEPAIALRHDRRFTTSLTPHRLHAPHETLQFVSHMTNRFKYKRRSLHLISDYAAHETFGDQGIGRDGLLDQLAALKAQWSEFAAFVIEISALREFRVTSSKGREIFVNPFCKREQEFYSAEIAAQAAAGLSQPLLSVNRSRLAPVRAVKVMRKIREAIGDRPVLWVSHVRAPSDEPEYEAVNAVRSELAGALRLGAEELGDAFFDPSVVAAEMGQAAFFRDDGKDLMHFTPAASAELARRYGDILLAQGLHERSAVL